MAHIEHSVAGDLRRITLNQKAVTYVVSNGPQLGVTAEKGADAFFAFYRSKRHFVLLIVGRAPVYVNRCKVSTLKIIREGDELAFETHSLTFRELITEVLVEGAEVIAKGKPCVLDGADFKVGERIVYCPACGKPCHERCWQFQKGRCPNRVCYYQAPWDEPEPRAL